MPPAVLAHLCRKALGLMDLFCKTSSGHDLTMRTLSLATYLGGDVHPLRERTEILVLSFVDGDVWVPQDERIEHGRRVQDSDRAPVFSRHLGSAI